MCRIRERLARGPGEHETRLPGAPIPQAEARCTHVTTGVNAAQLPRCRRRLILIFPPVIREKTTIWLPVMHLSQIRNHRQEHVHHVCLCSQGQIDSPQGNDQRDRETNIAGKTPPNRCVFPVIVLQAPSSETEAT